MNQFHTLIDQFSIETIQDWFQRNPSSISQVINSTVASTSVQNSYGQLEEFEWSPLHLAVRRGSAEIVQLLLKHGANLNYVTPTSKMTPLMLCCELVNLEIATILLDAGPSQLTKALFCLCHVYPRTEQKQAAIDIANLLLQKGADPNELDDSGRSPWILIANTANFELIHLFLSHGADPNAKCKKSKRYIIDLIGDHYLHTSNNLKREFFDKILLLSQYGTNMNAKSKYGNILNRSILCDMPLDFVKWLIETQHVDYLQRSSLFSFPLTKHCVLELDRATPAHLCAFLGKDDVLEYLLSRNKDIIEHTMMVFNELWTPLQCAIKGGHCGIHNMLLEKGAKVQRNILHISIGEGHGDCVIDLLAKNIIPLNEPIPCWLGQKDNFEKLLGCVYDGIPLFPAILRGSIEIVKLLLSVGADTNIPGRVISGRVGDHHIDHQLRLGNWSNVTPLQLAAYRGVPEIVKLIIEHGGDQKATTIIPWLKSLDQRAVTPLQIATYCSTSKSIAESGIPLDVNWELCCKYLSGEGVDLVIEDGQPVAIPANNTVSEELFNIFSGSAAPTADLESSSESSNEDVCLIS